MRTERLADIACTTSHDADPDPAGRWCAKHAQPIHQPAPHSAEPDGWTCEPADHLRNNPDATRCYYCGAELPTPDAAQPAAPMTEAPSVSHLRAAIAHLADITDETLADVVAPDLAHLTEALRRVDAYEL